MIQNEIKVLNCKVNVISKEAFLKTIEAYIKTHKLHTVVFLNPYIALEANNNPEVMDYINSSNMVVADGAGILIGARLLGSRISGRITGTDSMFSLAGLCANNGYGIYLLGSFPEVVSKATDALLAKFPNLKIVGKRDGYFATNEEDLIVDEINKNGPDILFVCLGVPKQELWIKKHKARLNVPVIIGNGAALDFLAGRFKRAPEWAQIIGLEWFFRLIQEPKRLWRRYLIGNILFIFLIIKQRFKR